MDLFLVVPHEQYKWQLMQENQYLYLINQRILDLNIKTANE
uniref:Uncharacterized protein n=1 Tax=CrAss-like virus sp. ctYsL76 TaxID=2826826 RepID=A0A8S5QN36_9CAUD|nr:MAG TPA: hypothetical protein [CrAss-like virus sp. ctYsL76]